MLYLSDFYLLYLLAFVGALIGYSKNYFEISSVLLIYSIAGLIIYLRNGNIRKSLKHLKQGNFRFAGILLLLTLPYFLSHRNKAYYLFIKGLILLGTDNKVALNLIRQALNSGFLEQNDRDLAMKILFGKNNQ